MKKIDLDQWPRRQVFDMFRQLDFPFVGLCADVEVTELLKYCQQHRLSSYRAICYGLILLSERMPWLRQRIHGDQVIEHSEIGLGVIALGEQDQLRFGRVAFADNWLRFNQQCQQEADRLANSNELVNESANDAVIYTTCLPWLRFTQFTHPVPLKPGCSVPRFGWGKYDAQGERTVMPLSVQVHHALADGLDIAKLYRELELLCAAPEQWLQPTP